MYLTRSLQSLELAEIEDKPALAPLSLVGPVTTRLPSTSSGPEHVEGSLSAPSSRPRGSSQAVPVRKTGGYGDPPYKPGTSVLAEGRSLF